MKTFEEFGLKQTILDALTKKGFTKASPIQEQTIPLLLGGVKNILGQARTGTGKTAAFGLPVLNTIKERSKHVQCLILAPTRELALQVASELDSLKGNLAIQILPVYGGQPMQPQIKALQRGVDIVVGTPGRIIDHIKRKTLRLNDIEFLILDEADEMCNMGFIDDVKIIMSETNENKKTLLFSATMPREVMNIAKKFMGEFEVVTVKSEEEPSKTEQCYILIEDRDRFEGLCRIIDSDPEFYGLIFCRTKADTDEVAALLSKRGYSAEPLHGDLTQARREDILNRFRTKRATIIVATDVAARGIDVAGISHVINFSIPQESETYVHRVGRTGRAGQKGLAITFIAPREKRKFSFLMRNTNLEAHKISLPRAEDIAETRKTHFVENLQKMISHGDSDQYLPLVEELLENNEAKDIVAALILQNVGEALNSKAYREIREPSLQAGRVSIFAALGKLHGLDPRTLIEGLLAKSQFQDFVIQDIRMFQSHSTFTLPEDSASDILRDINKTATDGRPIARLDKEGGGSGGGGGGGRRYDNRNRRPSGGGGGGGGGGGFKKPSFPGGGGGGGRRSPSKPKY